MLTDEQRKILEEVYYDPKQGLGSVDKIYQRVKNAKIQKKDIKAFIDEQEVAQVHKPLPRRIEYLSISAYSVDHIWQTDLCDVKKHSGTNKGIKWLLCIIDVYSRFAWVVPMKNKSKQTIVDSFETILKKRKPKHITSDAGSEYTSNLFRAMVEKHDIKHYIADVGDHNRMGVVERFNRTIKSLIARYMTAAQSRSYINVLDDLVHNYNTSIHSRLMKAPAEVKDGDIKPRPVKEPSIEYGDRVRTLRNKKAFEKGYTAKWSKGVYTVVNTVGFRFKLADKNNHELQRTYRSWELQKVKAPVTVAEVVEPEPTRDQRAVMKETRDLTITGVLPNKRKVISHIEVPERRKK